MEVEDDLFFADLSRQISLLIMDDDDDDDHEDHPVAICPAVSFQAFSRSSAYYPSTTPPSPFLYDQQQSCKRESKGTGVFIPQSSQPRRKNKHGRFSSFNTTKSHSRQQHDDDHHHNKARTTVSQQSSYNHNSLNPKKGSE
ncbi:hypothetical protein Ddye_022129 [Dipteronia dyeriana]|uniref:Uncharacterized protein n=1 Tax=Dipteronia dyeriana TaxID=168575 RepID=A0AAD9WWZ0_9ROSI|nr:hypothetical protein Ddye_022129 [Dipteronia dyeriana]